MPNPPGDPTPEQQTTSDVLRQMNHEEVHAFLAAWQAERLSGGPFQAPRNVVDLPDPPAEPSLLRVRVDLDGSRPAIWRRLELRDNLSVEQLHEVLQAAMGWADAHLHRFWLGPKKQIWTGPHLVTDADLEEGEEGVHERNVQVGQVLRAVGDRLFYTYDFGDDWTHTIKVEAVEPLPPDAPRAVCVGGRHACPPANVGGVHSHNELVAAWRETPDHSLVDPMYAESLPDSWDPTDFSPAQATQAIELAGVGIEEILALASLTPAMHPGLADVLSRADPATRRELARLLDWVDEHTTYEDEGPRLDSHTLGRAVRPWQLLLEIAGTQGIPLTAAGWMRPAVVQEVYDELGMAREWIGKGNREDLTLPVLELRESAQRAGLLRKNKGRLLVTPAGRRASGDDEALWKHLAARALPTRPGFERDASVLWLLGVSAEGDPEAVPGKQLANWLTALGWRSADGAVVQAVHLPEATRDVSDMVVRVASRKGRQSVDPVVARAFARAALLIEDD
ncbi:MAG: plasmid pRiA4b ORF-3 family protein [Ornithinimicrobium sp.]|uniref:plasmid pRiA4b ORF-3 family protein n=1 Tax=Ornithinimicrobium sp. TaxID=1977084 RepID=UPI003D9AD043